MFVRILSLLSQYCPHEHMFQGMRRGYIRGERLSEQKVIAANLTYCHLPTLFPRTQGPEQESQSHEQCFRKLQNLDLEFNKSSFLWLLTCS